MSTPVIYKGSFDNQLQVEGGKTVADTTTKKVVFKGLKTTMEAFQSGAYAKGSTYEIDWVVLSTVLDNLPGAMAKLTVNLVLKGGTTDSDPNPVSTIDTWEINWASVEKPLTANPTLVSQGSGTTQDTIDLVSAWRDSPQQRKRKYQVPLNTLTREADPMVDADWEDLPAAGEALKVCQKLAAGIEGYLAFHPIITKKSLYSRMPNTGGCGIINTPTVTVGTYVYLKTGDQAIEQQDKTWQRTETWQGADAWDTDLYPTG